MNQFPGLYWCFAEGGYDNCDEQTIVLWWNIDDPIANSSYGRLMKLTFPSYNYDIEKYVECRALENIL